MTQRGLNGFHRHERENRTTSLSEGPMKNFAVKLKNVRDALPADERWRIRTFLVTARNGPANTRACNTLKQWKLGIDESHFLGGLDKTGFLRAIDPAIYFDDSREHIDRAMNFIPAAHVPFGVRNVVGSHATTTENSNITTN